MSKGPRFETLVNEAKRRIREVSPREAFKMHAEGAVLVDVRESEEFENEHAVGAIHLSKGVLEWKVEQHVPEADTRLICYCGGGSRSALATESLTRMGYSNAVSMTGGFKAWREQGLPTQR